MECREDMKRKNILFIMADQMAAPMLPMYASSPIKMPHLSRLAAEGVVFDAAYCNSPLCAPSRFTLVSGQLPSKIGAYDNAAELPAGTPTIAHVLRAEGYGTSKTYEGADLVVTGTHHASLARRVFDGSVSIEVVEHASCPVAVVPLATSVEADRR